MRSQLARAGTRILARAIEALEARRLLSDTTLPTLDDLALTRLPLPSQHDEAILGVVGSKVIVVGGWGITTASDEVDLYDATTGQLSLGAPLPQPRANATVLTAAGKLFVNGGSTGDRSGDATLNSVVDYDPATNTWSTLPTSPAGPDVDLTPLGVIDDRLLYSTGSAVETYDADANQWAAEVALPAGAASPSATQLLGQDVLFFEPAGRIDVFHADTASFTTDQVAADANFTGAHTAVDGKVVFAGGYGSAPADGGVYDPAAATWSAQSTGAAPGAAVVTVGDKAIFAGGYGSSGAPYYFPSGSAAVALYDAATGQWSTAQLSASREDITAFTYHDKAYFSGGFVPYVGGDDALDVYDDATNQWSAFAPPQSPYDLPAGPVAIVNDEVVVESFNELDLLTPTALPTPTALAPTDAAGLAAPPTALRWAAVPGAASYDVYLDDAPAVLNTTATTWTIDHDVPIGNHSWQVVARDAQGHLTPGPRWTFIVGAPATPSDPSIAPGTALTQTPTQLAWAAVPRATSYRVYLDGQRIGSPATNSLALTAPIAGGQHAWTVVAYNALTSTLGPTWTFSTPVAPVATATTHFSLTASEISDAVKVGSKLFIYFGFFWDDGREPADVLVYDPLTGQSTATKLPDALEKSEAGWGSASAVIGDTVLLVGTGVAALYDLRTNTWTTHPLSTDRDQPTVAAVGDQFVIAGGYDDKTDLASDAVDVFNTTTGQWSTARLSQARWQSTPAVVGNTLYLAGGIGGTYYQGEVAADAVDVYNATTGAWSTTQPLSAARASAASVLVANRYLVFAGGTTPASSITVNITNALDVLDLATNTWTNDQVPGDGEFFDGQAIAVGDRAYLVSSGTGAAGTLYAYDPANRAWDQQPLPASSYPNSLTTLSNRYLLLAGSGSTMEVFDTRTGRATFAPLPNGNAGPVVQFGPHRVIAITTDDDGHATADTYTDPAAPPPAVTGELSAVRTTPGHSTTATLTLRAAAVGNTLAGPIHYTVYASPSPTLDRRAVPLLSGSVTPRRSQRRQARLRLALRAPSTLTGGPWYLIATVETADAAATVSTGHTVVDVPPQRHPARTHP